MKLKFGEMVANSASDGTEIFSIVRVIWSLILSMQRETSPPPFYEFIKAFFPRRAAQHSSRKNSESVREFSLIDNISRIKTN